MNANPDYEAGLAHGALHSLITASVALESAANRLERARRCGALEKADRIEIRKAIMIIDGAREKLSDATVALERAA